MKCKFCGADVALGRKCEYCGSIAEPHYYPEVPSPLIQPKKENYKEVLKEYKEYAEIEEKRSHYTVKKGDTLWSIAKKCYGKGKLYPLIAKMNNIENPNRIYPGQILKIYGRRHHDGTEDEYLTRLQAMSNIEKERYLLGEWGKER